MVSIWWMQILHILTIGLSSKILNRIFIESKLDEFGDMEVWPFRNKDELNQVKQTPIYFYEKAN